MGGRFWFDFGFRFVRLVGNYRLSSSRVEVRVFCCVGDFGIIFVISLVNIRVFKGVSIRDFLFCSFGFIF